MMAVGLLTGTLTAALFVQVARGLPSGESHHLRIWALALALQPLAWAALAMRGYWPPLWSIGLGTFLMLASYAEMTRAVRGFQGLAERRGLLWTLVLGAFAASLLLDDSWPNSSIRVVVNSGAGLILMSAMAWAFWRGRGAGGGHAAGGAAVFALLGVAAMAWRIVDHLRHARPSGDLLAAGASDSLAFLYLLAGTIFLSLGFVLMHAERAYASLRRIASVDALTGVLARGAMEERGRELVERAARGERTMAALLLDLDRFKDVNDRLGHEAGDRMLRHLAEQARLVLRGEDLLCRLGGDEFVALLPNTDLAGARIVAERLREALSAQALVIRGQSIPIPLSIGVAASLGASDDLESLIRRADQAMYDAKRAGGDRIAVAAMS